MNTSLPTDSHDNGSMRLDKWLWAARFYKTRALAVEEINKGRVQINGQPCKPARDVRCGDTISLRQGAMPRTVTVQSLSARRGPAPLPRRFIPKPEKAWPCARPWPSSAVSHPNRRTV